MATIDNVIGAIGGVVLVLGFIGVRAGSMRWRGWLGLALVTVLICAALIGVNHLIFAAGRAIA